jgi:UDP-4-amino-4,6-dideoxy-N-acetyl-beta-L-altrosamine transaminase
MKLPYGKQWINDADIRKVLEVLESDYLTTGPYVQEFENKFAKTVGARYAVAVANGTAALHLAAKALDVQSGSEVLTTPISFAATSNCVLYNNGKPVFCDINERGLIDPTDINKKITEKTNGIIPVHYMGLPCDLHEISEIAGDNGLFLIEDACHALGAKLRKKSIGNCAYSDLSVFSFHPVKHITTGEGGIITTNDSRLDNLLRTLRTHGITRNQSKFKSKHTEPWYQEMLYLGYNYRLTDLQAALGLSQLQRLDEFVQRRRAIAKMYDEFFEELEEVETIPEMDGEFHSYHLYVIKVETATIRRKLFESLANVGIYCQVHYIPIYWHPYYRKNGYAEERLSRTEQFYERIISLPMYPALSDSDLEFVLESIENFFSRLIR